MRLPTRPGLLPVLLFLLLATLAPRALAAEFLVYFGTYTGKSSKGIYLSRLQAESGQLAPPTLAAETPSPSFLALAPDGKCLYAVNEVSTFEGKAAGAVTAYRVDPPDGRLTMLNRVSSGGGAPCHVTVDASGRTVLVANYSGGNVASFAIQKDGSLGPGSLIQHAGSSVNKSRQAGPHGHYISPDPANRFALACDLGLDQVLVYRLDPAKAALEPHAPPHASLPPGSGPRHLAFRPDGRFVYVINEMTCTMTTFRYDAARGVLKRQDTVSTLPEGEAVKPAYSTAEVEVHPSGKFLYGSNRGHDTLVVFAINPDGSLRRVEHVSTRGRTPRSFGIDPTGRWLLAANQSSDTVVVFRIDAATGKLTPTGQEIAVGAPVCVKFLPVR